MTEPFCPGGVSEEVESLVLVKQESFLNQSNQQLGFDGIEDEEENEFVPLHDPLALDQEDEDGFSFNYDPNSQIVGKNTTKESTMAANSSARSHIETSRSEVDDIEGVNSDPSVIPFDQMPVKLEPTSPSQELDPASTSSITYVAFKPTQKTFLCTQCGIPFYSDVMFQKHIHKFHGENLKHTCRHCGKKFTSKSNMKRHASIHDPKRWQGKPKYACDFCEKAYHLKVSLEGHRKEKHLGYAKRKFRTNLVVRHHRAKGVRNPRSEPRPEKKLHPCSHCDLLFQYKHEVRIHSSVHLSEKLFKCEFCEQTLKTPASLRKHIQKVHLNPKLFSNARPRPTSMANQPCPCIICGKVFKVPSQLRKHITIHTGEKPHECDICGQKFRLANGLRSHKIMHTNKHEGPDRVRYKCMICGKDKFPRVAALNAHRRKAHPLIPYESDKEKAFACGICGKPWFLKEQAMVCAILRHDPTSLLQQMFKIKCPACPKERFWHRSTNACRKHWEEEHQGQTIPANLRQGMYQAQPAVDPLPNVVVNKEMQKEILDNGSSVKFEYPLYVELDLVDVPDSLKKRPKRIRARIGSHPKDYDVSCQCTICGLVLSRASNLSRHIKTHQKGPYVLQRIECPICNQSFRKMKTFRLHQKMHKTGQTKCPEKRKPGRSFKHSLVASHVSTQPAINFETSSNSNQVLEPITFQASYIGQRNRWNDWAVNCNDAEAVVKLLGNKTVRVVVTKCDGVEQQLIRSDYREMFENIVSVCVNDVRAVQTVLQHQSLSIVLFRC